MAEFSSRGVGNAGLATGIIGSALGALNSGLLGGWGNNMGYGGYGGFDGYDRQHGWGGWIKEISEKDSEIAELKSEKYSDKVGLELYRYIDGKLMEVEKRLGEQAVMNQATKDGYKMLCDRIADESAARKCADNTIVNYVNATFYPKMIADITTAATTTAQFTYNPLPNCGCGSNPYE